MGRLFARNERMRVVIRNAARFLAAMVVA